MHFDQMSENVDLTCEPLVVGDVEDAKTLMTSYSLYLLGVCALMLKDKIRNWTEEKSNTLDFQSCSVGWARY